MAKHASVKVSMDKDLQKFFKDPKKQMEKAMKGKKTEIECPNCNKKFTAVIGKVNKCPSCKETVEIKF